MAEGKKLVVTVEVYWTAVQRAEGKPARIEVSSLAELVTANEEPDCVLVYRRADGTEIPSFEVAWAEMGGAHADRPDIVKAKAQPA
jgi:hypothetical protein